MDTRRLKLLLVAHLRGYMQPGRHLGIQAQVREKMVLDAVQMEIEAERQKIQLLAVSSVLGSRQIPADKMIDMIQEDTGAIVRRMSMDPGGGQEEAPKDIDKLVDLYTILQQSDFFKNKTKN